MYTNSMGKYLKHCCLLNKHTSIQHILTTHSDEPELDLAITLLYRVSGHVITV